VTARRARRRDGDVGVPGAERLGDRVPPPRTKWTRRVRHPVLIGHAASLSQVIGTLTARAKTVIEVEEMFGGSGSETHAATVTGSLFAGPLRDCFAPVVMAGTRHMCTAALVIAPLVQGDATAWFAECVAANLLNGESVNICWDWGRAYWVIIPGVITLALGGASFWFFWRGALRAHLDDPAPHPLPPIGCEPPCPRPATAPPRLPRGGCSPRGVLLPPHPPRRPARAVSLTARRCGTRQGARNRGADGARSPAGQAWRRARCVSRRPDVRGVVQGARSGAGTGARSGACTVVHTQGRASAQASPGGAAHREPEQPAGAPPPPSRTKWTRLVHPSVLSGHVHVNARQPCGSHLRSASPRAALLTHSAHVRSAPRSPLRRCRATT